MPRIEEFGGGGVTARRIRAPVQSVLPQVTGEPYIRQLNRYIAGGRSVAPSSIRYLLEPGRRIGGIPGESLANALYGFGTPFGPVPDVPPISSLFPSPVVGGGGDGGGGDGGGGWPAPTPWAVNLRFPESPFRQWFTQNVPWYNPLGSLAEGQVAGLSPEIANQLLVLNAMLPFLGQEDVGPMARFLAMATGGGTGPFAGYLQAPPVGSPVRQQVGEARRLEDALAVARLMSEPGARALAEGTLGLGISGLGAGARPDGALGPQDIVARSRENWMRFQQGLAGLGGTTGPGAAISPFLQRLALPSQLRPLPGQLTRTDGGFQVAPNLRWLVG